MWNVILLFSSVTNFFALLGIPNVTKFRIQH